jgi:hypothetical protein
MAIDMGFNLSKDSSMIRLLPFFLLDDRTQLIMKGSGAQASLGK